jgi:hypothetical protein
MRRRVRHGREIDALIKDWNQQNKTGNKGAYAYTSETTALTNKDGWIRLAKRQESGVSGSGTTQLIYLVDGTVWDVDST